MVMPLWAQYQVCRQTGDVESARALADRLHRTSVREVELPVWMKFFGAHVAAQPLRVTIDPRALSAACALRAARLATEANRFPEAEVRYHDIIERYAGVEYAYYVEQARQGLIELTPALLARTLGSPR
jgi:hypothetical protein